MDQVISAIEGRTALDAVPEARAELDAAEAVRAEKRAKFYEAVVAAREDRWKIRHICSRAGLQPNRIHQILLEHRTAA